MDNKYSGQPMNPNLIKLTELLRMAAPAGPSHGYTISEKGPEVVTAPGVYFPAEKGNVIPLEPRFMGGSVSGSPPQPTPSPLPELSKDNDRAKLEMLHSIISQVKPNQKYESRQFGGPVVPSPIDEIEKSKYDILKGALSILKPQQEKKSLTDSNAAGIKSPSIKSPSMFPESPNPTKFPTVDRMDMKPEIPKTEGDLLWEKKRKEGTEAGQWSTPMFSREAGGPVDPAALELEERKKWEIPGYPEQVLAEARQASPNVVGVQPGFERSYYEAHPEEKRAQDVYDMLRPPGENSFEAARERMRVGGLMDIARTPTETKEARTGAVALAGGMQKTRADQEFAAQQAAGKAGLPVKTSAVRATSTKLVQDASGQWVEIGPQGILPTGVMGLPKEKTPNEWNLTQKASEVGPDGKPTPEAINAQKVLDAEKKRKIEIAGGGIPGLPTNISSGIGGVKNEDALQGLSPEDSAIVKKLVNYDYQPPGGWAIRSPRLQALLGRAAIYDPSFDQTQYVVKQKLRNDFTSGKSAQNIRSLNTAVNHLDTLSKKADALKNAGVQIWNAIANKGLTEFGDKRVTEFNNAATAVESELANVFKGMGASDQEIKQWRSNLSSSQSPEQIKGSIDTVIQLMGGRLGALISQYETGMGKPKEFKILSNKSRNVLQRLGVDVEALEPSVGGKIETGEKESATIQKSPGSIKVDPSKIKEGW